MAFANELLQMNYFAKRNGSNGTFEQHVHSGMTFPFPCIFFPPTRDVWCAIELVQFRCHGSAKDMVRMGANQLNSNDMVPQKILENIFFKIEAEYGNDSFLNRHSDSSSHPRRQTIYHTKYYNTNKFYVCVCACKFYVKNKRF